MKKIMFILISLITLIFILAGCGKTIAGQAVAGFSDDGCVSGKWYYKDSAPKVTGPFEGCTLENEKKHGARQK